MSEKITATVKLLNPIWKLSYTSVCRWDCGEVVWTLSCTHFLERSLLPALWKSMYYSGPHKSRGCRQTVSQKWFSSGAAGGTGATDHSENEVNLQKFRNGAVWCNYNLTAGTDMFHCWPNRSSSSYLLSNNCQKTKHLIFTSFAIGFFFFFAKLCHIYYICLFIKIYLWIQARFVF